VKNYQINAVAKAAGLINVSIQTLADSIGTLLVDGFHLLALFAIGATTVWASLVAFYGMMVSGHVTIEDLLLLFIYLEIGAMVGIYFKTNRMPVQFLIYVAITALTRHLIASINISHEASLTSQIEYNVVVIPCGILILALAVLTIRIGSNKFPSVQIDIPYSESKMSEDT